MSQAWNGMTILRGDKIYERPSMHLGVFRCFTWGVAWICVEHFMDILRRPQYPFKDIHPTHISWGYVCCLSYQCFLEYTFHFHVMTNTCERGINQWVYIFIFGTPS